MCGFLGWVGFTVADGVIDRLRDVAASSIRHRGPDGSGHFSDDQICVRCFRLALNGGSSGDQPCRSGPSLVVYNGETYNLSGVPLHISGVAGDTWRVTEHLAHDGDPSALDGMFALAEWRQSDGVLRLLRDRFGIKPLYWSSAPDGLAFGSRASAVRRLVGAGGIPGEAIVAYLSLRGPFADQDLFTGVHAVAPGGSVAWSTSAGVSTDRWWTALDDTAPLPRRPSPDELEQAILRSVDATMRASAPVGLCLSGGVDSSLLVAMARHLHGPDVPTYILSSATNQDDVDAALEVARGLDLTPRVVDMTSNWPETLEHLVPLLDEPPITESALGVAALAAAARADGVKALVSGEGADEIFGGYDEYREREFTVDAQLPESSWLRTHVRPWLQDDVDRFENRLANKLDEHRNRGGGPGTFDLESRLARLLRRLDSAMMAYGVEGRVPYLVEDVATLGMACPWSERTAGLGKEPLRAVARRWLPDWVSDRPKRPFASGVRQRPEVVRRMLDNGREALADVVTPEFVELCWQAPGDPQAWKVAALGTFLAAHDIGVEAGVAVPS